MQETHFIWAPVLEDDLIALSALGSRCSAGVSLLIGRSLNADVDAIFEGDGHRLVVTNVAVKNFAFRVVAVYAPNYIGERRTFFRWLEPFLGDSKWIVLVRD